MPQDGKDYQTTYIQLRTLLDAVEMGSLRYCLELKGNKARIKRMEQVIEDLKKVEKIIRERRVEQRPSAAPVAAAALARGASDAPIEGDFQPDAPGDNGCPDGYYRCGAACVPYPCP